MPVRLAVKEEAGKVESDCAKADRAQLTQPRAIAAMAKETIPRREGWIFIGFLEDARPDEMGRSAQYAVGRAGTAERKINTVGAGNGHWTSGGGITKGLTVSDLDIS
jgi:hypothetical protein